MIFYGLIYQFFYFFEPIVQIKKISFRKINDLKKVDILIIWVDENGSWIDTRLTMKLLWIIFKSSLFIIFIIFIIGKTPNWFWMAW